VESQVTFHNRFVSPEEMVAFIGAADIYITPYRMRRRWFPERWPMRWARARRSSRLPIGTRLSCWTTAEARWSHSRIPTRSRKDNRTAGYTCDLATPCVSAPTCFARDMVWKRVAQGYMESFARVRSDRMETPRVQFSARARSQSVGPIAGVETGSFEAR
jgi:hypothetical protein